MEKRIIDPDKIETPDAAKTLDTSGFRIEKRDLEEDDEDSNPEKNTLDELRNLHSEMAVLTGKKKDRKIEDEEIKRKLARTAFYILNNTPSKKEIIMERAAILSTFKEFHFQDDLNRLFEQAEKIKMPENNKEFVFETWKGMQNLLRKYIEEKNY